MDKVGELEESNGAFEVCWLHPWTNQQIRFNGTAHIHRYNGLDFPEIYLKRYIRTLGEWTWERERDRLWKSHKPRMRGTFRNPTPGTPLDAEKKQKLKDVELDSDDDSQEAREAKERFSLLVLEVTQIEILDLDPPVWISVRPYILTHVGCEAQMDTQRSLRRFGVNLG